jgi:hypothetical protein
MTVEQSRDPGDVFRMAFLALAGLTTVGLALELTLERHWNGFIQRIPWAGIILLTFALLLVLVQPKRGTIWTARGIAIGVVVIGLIGVFEHVLANYNAGPLDFRYAEKWDTMSATARWWAAASKTVGPSPVLAPMALGQAAALCLLATVRHPAMKTAEGEPGPRRGRQ